MYETRLQLICKPLTLLADEFRFVNIEVQSE